MNNYFPPKLLDQMNSRQKAMLFKGREIFEKNEQGYNNNHNNNYYGNNKSETRNVAVSKITETKQDNKNEEEDSEDESNKKEKEWSYPTYIAWDPLQEDGRQK